MNKVILVGRLTKDPETRMTQTGKKVASFSIAVDDGKDTSGAKISQYFNCSAWDSQADIIELYVKKGHRIAVIGKLQNRSWDKADGTKGYATDIAVRELELLTSKAEADSMPSSDSPATSAPKTSAPKPSSKDEEEQLPEIDVDSINVQMPF